MKSNEKKCSDEQLDEEVNEMLRWKVIVGQSQDAITIGFKPIPAERPKERTSKYGSNIVAPKSK